MVDMVGLLTLTAVRFKMTDRTDPFKKTCNAKRRGKKWKRKQKNSDDE